MNSAFISTIHTYHSYNRLDELRFKEYNLLGINLNDEDENGIICAERLTERPLSIHSS